jgi:hypothetical protein
MGLLCTADKAAQYGKPYSGSPPKLDLQGRALCPLCNNPDSNTHLMVGCEKNPEFTSLHIKRHNIAVLSVAQTIAGSQLHKPLHGGFYFC